MDTLGALALSTEPPAEDVLDRLPADKDEQIISPYMWRNIVCHAFIQIIMLLILIFVIPGWLVHDYQILQKNIPFVKVDGVDTCKGFLKKKNTNALY